MRIQTGYRGLVERAPRSSGMTAVAAVQRRLGLQPTGRVDRVTAMALQKTYPDANLRTVPMRQVAAQLLAPNAGTIAGTVAPLIGGLVPAPSSMAVSAMGPQVGTTSTTRVTSDLPALNIVRDVPGPAIAQTTSVPVARSTRSLPSSDVVTVPTDPGVPFQTTADALPGGTVGGIPITVIGIGLIAAAMLIRSARSNPRRRRRRR